MRFWLLPVVILSLAGLLAAQPSAALGRPNVLLIVLDDLNDWVTPGERPAQVQCPNVDRLAQRGVWFRNAHCAAPSCNPSRTAFLTGIPPHVSGVYLNNQPWRIGLPDAQTLPGWFRAQGYESLGAGKIFHGKPDAASFDRYFPSLQENKPDDPKPEDRPVNGIPKTGHFDWGPLDVPDGEMGDHLVTGWVAERLRERHDRPFFLACGIFRPHLPWYVPRADFDALPSEEDIALPIVPEDDLDDVPAAGRAMAKPSGDHRKVLKHGQWHRAVQSYLASIRFADRMLGRVLDALEQGPHASDTIVVLVGDHGWHLGEKHHWRKFTLWEEATRVPFFVRVPEGTPGLPEGTPEALPCATQVSLLDLFRTLTELCALETPDGIHGVSLVPWLREPGKERDLPVLTTHGFKNHALRDARHRYVRYEDGSEELYDHAVDPMEWNNLASEPVLRPTLERFRTLIPKTDAKPTPKK